MSQQMTVVVSEESSILVVDGSTQTLIVADGEPEILVVESGPQGAPGVGATNTYSRTETDGLITEAVMLHAIDPEPHPTYDDIPSLTLLFENRLI